VISTNPGIESLLEGQEWFPDRMWWRTEARETGFIDETGDGLDSDNAEKE